MKFELSVELNETTLTVEQLEDWVEEQELCTMEAIIAQVNEVIEIELYSTFDCISDFAEAIAALGELIEESLV